MQVINLHSLNVEDEHFLLLLYHATGRAFLFEWETLSLEFTITDEDCRRKMLRRQELIEDAFASCRDVEIHVHRIFPDEAKLFPNRHRERERIMRKEIERALAFIRRLRKHNLTCRIENMADLRLLRNASPPLADWLSSAQDASAETMGVIDVSPVNALSTTSAKA